ncbi:unnamed protein product [Protopolystoma xenopodis]|uniref:Uncharacterized protein n=1 Tax=Protopolystoma xenopodis TaxID=117903 RepID=A0A448WV07_9PLAT|nr:unnamed protein product [Protopolystoma xenopodis]
MFLIHIFSQGSRDWSDVGDARSTLLGRRLQAGNRVPSLSLPSDHIGQLEINVATAHRAPSLYQELQHGLFSPHQPHEILHSSPSTLDEVDTDKLRGLAQWQAVFNEVDQFDIEAEELENAFPTVSSLGSSSTSAEEEENEMLEGGLRFSSAESMPFTGGSGGKQISEGGVSGDVKDSVRVLGPGHNRLSLGLLVRSEAGPLSDRAHQLTYSSLLLSLTTLLLLPIILKLRVQSDS